MTGRITTRAGRKIRHVAPGHVVDVATGMAWVRLPLYPSARHAADFRWFPGRTDTCIFGGERTLDDALRLLNVAAGICALVRALVEAWQAEHADLMYERAQMEHEAALTASPYR